VSVIANFQPVVVRSLAASDLQPLLKNYSYARFPVVDGEQLVGILSRDEAQLALKENRQPQLLPPVFGQPSQSVQDLQAKLIESGVGIVVLLDRPGGKVLGLVTLHDLLRAQAAFAKDSDT
jgi:CIC family chloride channel protein